MSKSTEIVIIGGGAAGLLCAGMCAQGGCGVTLIEKMNRPGRKLMITGKGRCNLTNASFTLDEMMDGVVKNKEFLYSAFSHFMPYDTMEFFQHRGVELKTERGGRVFPQSDKASDIVDALVSFCKENNVNIINEKAVAFEFKEKSIKNIICDSGKKIPCKSAVLCTGGKSYPLTGSTGDGYALAKSAGHTVTPLSGALVPIVCSDGFISDLTGLSLRNISAELYKNGKKIYSDFGEMLFTHFGVSGPVMLSASSHIKNADENNYEIKIDLKPALDEKTLDLRIQRDFREFANKNFINSLSKLLPDKLIPVIVKLSGIEAGKKVNSITRRERLGLVKLLKCFCISVTGLRPIEEAIVTSGGVSVKEINPKTMKSKIIDNLYFAGEIIDVDAYTGGFNLQIAFSTAALCADSIIKSKQKLLHKES